MSPVRTIALVALVLELLHSRAVAAQTDPSSVGSIFELVAQNGLSLSLAILLVWGAFTQRISFDGKDERKRRAAIDDKIQRKLDRLLHKSGISMDDG